MLFTLVDVSVEVGDLFDTHRFEACDVAQALDVSRRQSDMYAKFQHVFANRGPLQIRHPAQIDLRICICCSG